MGADLARVLQGYIHTADDAFPGNMAGEPPVRRFVWCRRSISAHHGEYGWVFTVLSNGVNAGGY